MERLYNYDAIVILPYSRRESKNGFKRKYRMSSPTARSVLAGLDLYNEEQAPLLLLPGEETSPSTCELEREYLVGKRGVEPENVIIFPNLNGTQQQLDPIAKLQKEKSVGKVIVVTFRFHAPRTQEIMRRWGIYGDITIVQDLEEKYGRTHNSPTSKKFDEVTENAERGIPNLLMKLDKPFGKTAPCGRIAKAIMGPTITDIDNVGLVRIEKLREALHKISQNFTRSYKL